MSTASVLSALQHVLLLNRRMEQNNPGVRLTRGPGCTCRWPPCSRSQSLWMPASTRACARCCQSNPPVQQGNMAGGARPNRLPSNVGPMSVPAAMHSTRGQPAAAGHVSTICPTCASPLPSWGFSRHHLVSAEGKQRLREVTPQSGAAGAGAAPVSPPSPSPHPTEGASPGCSCQSVLHWMAARPGGRRCRLLGRTAAVKGFGASARRSCIVATISVLAQTDQRCRRAWRLLCGGKCDCQRGSPLSELACSVLGGSQSDLQAVEQLHGPGL